jgi:hypothetical protein
MDGTLENMEIVVTGSKFLSEKYKKKTLILTIFMYIIFCCCWNLSVELAVMESFQSCNNFKALQIIFVVEYVLNW